jgi:hypothetical protein
MNWIVIKKVLKIVSIGSLVHWYLWNYFDKILSFYFRIKLSSIIFLDFYVDDKFWVFAKLYWMFPSNFKVALKVMKSHLWRRTSWWLWGQLGETNSSMLPKRLLMFSAWRQANKQTKNSIWICEQKPICRNMASSVVTVVKKYNIFIGETNSLCSTYRNP